MPEFPISSVNTDTMRATNPPRMYYYPILLLLAGGVGMLLMTWYYQIMTGMGVAGIDHPIGWGVYIANFVFWVGIAHSGTLVSAILFLVRAKWRDTVSRSSEAMTLIAIMIAGLFPLIHLGRVWVFYFIIPYPTQRNIYPNFISPLVWDVLAVFTYFTVSTIFFYVGLLPDLRTGVDWARKHLKPGSIRERVYGLLALGWYNGTSQWQHHDRAYLYFAALLTPLVISVHSIVSWDFAMGLPPGWHTTIFAPYFVAGAIHSGLAMMFVLLIPMRKLLGLENIIRTHHLEMVGRTMLVTTAIMGYSYLVDPLVAYFYGHEIPDMQYILYRAFGGVISWNYWLVMVLNVLIPFMLAFPRLRRRHGVLMVVGISVVAGMWLERFMLVPSPLSHEYMPHAWSQYIPRWPEIAITFGSFCMFFMLFLVFSKTLPTVPMADLKSMLVDERAKLSKMEVTPPKRKARKADLNAFGLMAVYDNASAMVEGTADLLGRGWDRMEGFSPTKLPSLMKVMGLERSLLRFTTFIGVLSGAAGGFWLAGGTAMANRLIVGGKGMVEVIPYLIPTFEGAVLIGSLVNLGVLFVLAQVWKRKPWPCYDPRFSNNRWGLFVQCEPKDREALQQAMTSTGPQEIHIYE